MIAPSAALGKVLDPTIEHLTNGTVVPDFARGPARLLGNALDEGLLRLNALESNFPIRVVRRAKLDKEFRASFELGRESGLYAAGLPSMLDGPRAPRPRHLRSV